MPSTKTSHPIKSLRIRLILSTVVAALLITALSLTGYCFRSLDWKEESFYLSKAFEHASRNGKLAWRAYATEGAANFSERETLKGEVSDLSELLKIFPNCCTYNYTGDLPFPSDHLFGHLVTIKFGTYETYILMNNCGSLIDKGSIQLRLNKAPKL